MVGAGTAMILLALWAVYKVVIKKGSLDGWIGKIFIFAIALPYLANTFGWIMTELGRQPWAVYGLLKLEDAVSPQVTTGQVLMSLIGFVLLYGALMVADIYLLRKFALAGPGKEE